MTYLPSRTAWARNALALIAGLTIGIFADGSLDVLALSVVAFLVGYFSETAFAMLDRIASDVFSLAEEGVNRPPGGGATSPRAPVSRPSAAQVKLEEMSLLSRTVSESVSSILAAPQAINYTGKLSVDIVDRDGQSVIVSTGPRPLVCFPSPGLYRLAAWFAPGTEPNLTPVNAAITITDGRSPAGRKVPFELRADLGFAQLPLRRKEIEVDPAKLCEIDLGPFEVLPPDATPGPVVPDYPVAVTVYQHGRRYATCVIAPADIPT